LVLDKAKNAGIASYSKYFQRNIVSINEGDWSGSYSFHFTKTVQCKKNRPGDYSSDLLYFRICLGFCF